MMAKIHITCLKSKLRILLPACVLLVSIGLWSCKTTGPDNPVVEPPAGETGFLSIDMIYDNTGKTRAGEMAGIEEEEAFNSILFVLYNEQTGAAEYIDYYTVAGDGTVLTATDDVDNITLGLSYDGKTKINKRFASVAIKKYKLAVIVNNGLENANLNTVMVDEWSGDLMGTMLKTAGHDISLLSTPLEISGYTGGTATIDKGIGTALTGMSISYPSDADYSSDRAMLASMRIVMSNADGLVDVNTTDFHATATGAQQNPVDMRVERAVAKVAVFRNLDPDNLSHGARVADLGWACDIINRHTYLVRQLAPTAPTNGGAIENTGIGRQYRYALDPNFIGYSNDLNGVGTCDLSTQFFRLEDMGDASGVFYKTWNTVSADSPAEDWTAWEYVTENTMAAEEQYEDVTTRVVIKCNYIPGNGNSTATIQAGESYYCYNGIAVSVGQMKAFYNDPSIIPEDLYPALAGLEDLVVDAEVISGFGWPAAFDDPGVSKEMKGISFYRDGVNYYRILIRHFDDILSPVKMGYGRFGVVRNNVYKIKVNDITGPGSVKIPDPGGPDEGEDPATEIVVTPWETIGLKFDL